MNLVLSDSALLCAPINGTKITQLMETCNPQVDNQPLTACLLKSLSLKDDLGLNNHISYKMIHCDNRLGKTAVCSKGMDSKNRRMVCFLDKTNAFD